MTHREYAKAFVEHVVNKAGDGDCLETFVLVFALNKDEPLHIPVIAATSFLNAFWYYLCGERIQKTEGNNDNALILLENAVNNVEFTARVQKTNHKDEDHRIFE